MGITFTGGVQIFILLVWFGLSIAMIAIGVKYKDKCRLQPLIPIYLIVAGASYLLTILLLPLKCFFRQLCAVLEGFLLIFIVCWLIAGSWWVFSIYLVYPFFCSSVVYRFSFGVVVFQYIYIVIFSVTLVLVICFVGFKGLTKASLI
ncbi:transmembrane protein 272-like isoform 1-T2 [Anomaloglossus baeobatrachus]|uniref:transmembrane protein 272-like n=1 Tax=Anomaloglossus baeobatrachus TaxID=238106 RepID=UPI003F502809